MPDANPLPEYLRCKLKKSSKLASSEDIIKMAGPKAAQFLYNAISVGPRVILRSAFELLRANFITRILSCAVLLSIDTVNLVRKRISVQQFLVNITLALLLLVGGTVGWNVGGMVVGMTLIENAAIGIMAALVGSGIFGLGLAYVGEKFISLFFKGDTERMVELFNFEFYCEVTEKCLKEEEIAKARDAIELTPKVASDMYACEDKRGFARSIICPAIQALMSEKQETSDEKRDSISTSAS